jgi:enoyl-CoA hydratase/carnithine racemase
MSDVIAPVVRMERDGRVARVVIGSGVRRNALTTGGWAGLERVMLGLADDDTLRAVVVEGAAGWFCAGSDIREWERATPEQVELSFSRMEATCTAIENLPVPVIAKVRGAAAGAGCQLALACDMRIVSDNASIGMPIALLGILVSPSFANRLAVHCGPSVAGELLYTGRMVHAEEAVRLGLANACVPSDQLENQVDVAVDAILRVSGASVRAAKRALAQLAAPVRTAEGPPVDYDDFRRGVAGFVHRGGSRPRSARASP